MKIKRTGSPQILWDRRRVKTGDVIDVTDVQGAELLGRDGWEKVAASRRQPADTPLTTAEKE